MSDACAHILINKQTWKYDKQINKIQQAQDQTMKKYYKWIRGLSTMVKWMMGAVERGKMKGKIGGQVYI